MNELTKALASLEAVQFELPEGLSQEEVGALKEEGCAFIGTLPSIRAFDRVGSSVYLCWPKDVDFAVLIDPLRTNLMSWAPAFLRDHMLDGWLPSGDDEYGAPGFGSTWTSFRKGNLNLIVTDDKDWYDDFKVATQLCIALDLKEKWQRIRVCRIVRDGMQAADLANYADCQP